MADSDRFVCDKCGQVVPPSNDAALLDAYLDGSTSAGLRALFAQSRHLLPIVKGSVVACAGSPSRAQYLEGQARDLRGEYPYDLKAEVLYRQAYAKLLANGA